MSETEDERWQRLARDRYQRPLPRRFYKEATVSPTNSILLDGKPVRTPMKRELVLPTHALAHAISEEWQDQQQVINPHLMPLTKLANTAIDRGSAHAAAIRSEIASYAGNDLVCYRATEPSELVGRQDLCWDPVLQWAKATFGYSWQVTSGMSHLEQPSEALAAAAKHIEGMCPFTLVALHALTTVSGSALIALQLASAGIEAEAAWAAASLDEKWQQEKWGYDREAETALLAKRVEFMAAARFLNLAGNLPGSAGVLP